MTSTAYDLVEYPNLCHPQTHPDRLAVVAELLGLRPAPPADCRVLELGCGNGANLLPLAFMHRRSRYCGLDLAPTVVEAGRSQAASLGLQNLELEQGDLREFPRTGERFHYIIAHGVYSWIPQEARESLLAICRGRLEPDGVAFISYNCLPGCHIRRMVWEIMQFHVRHLRDPGERVRQAVGITRFIANSIDKPDTYRQLFRDQLEQIQKYGPGHLFHDDLAAINEPVYFHEFVARAASHGLKFLGEADFFELQDEAFSEEARRILGSFGDDRLTREQYLDFIKARRFRQTLLCPAEAVPRWPPDPGAVAGFAISSSARGDEASSDLAGRSVARFSEPTGGALEVDLPLAKAAFQVLAEQWPATVGFDELFDAARSRLPGDPGMPLSEARSILAEVMLEGFRSGVVDFRKSPVRCLAKPSDRPRVWDFARWRTQRQEVAVTLRGDNLRVEDADGRRLIELLDGTRSIEDLRVAMRNAGDDSGAGGSGSDTRLEHRLADLARYALFDS